MLTIEHEKTFWLRANSSELVAHGDVSVFVSHNRALIQISAISAQRDSQEGCETAFNKKPKRWALTEWPLCLITVHSVYWLKKHRTQFVDQSPACLRQKYCCKDSETKTKCTKQTSTILHYDTGQRKHSTTTIPNPLPTACSDLNILEHM